MCKALTPRSGGRSKGLHYALEAIYRPGIAARVQSPAATASATRTTLTGSRAESSRAFIIIIAADRRISEIPDQGCEGG
jgi:hypothetical protein